MSKPLKKFDRAHVGYYINYIVANNTQPFQIVGTLSENQTETPNATYINDEWFEYITTATHNPRPIISGNTIINAVNDVSRIDDYIIKNFSCRFVFSDDFCTWVDYDFKPADVLTISAPLIFQKIARSKVRSLFENKREEYKRLWEIHTADYNPLNDFDNYEKETHKGTDTTAHGGTDTVANTGSDTTAHSGKDTTENSGTDTIANTGTDTTAHSGKDTTQNSGTDTTTRTGAESNAHTGTNTNANTGTDTNNGFTYAFESVADVPKDKNTTTYGKSETTTFNDTVATTYNSVADATAHGLKTELTHGESIQTTHGKSETTTHGLKTELTHGESIQTTHGKSTTTTHGETIGLTHGEIIEKESRGSNMSPAELLAEHRKLWEDFNILGIIATDVIKEISV